MKQTMKKMKSVSFVLCAVFAVLFNSVCVFAEEESSLAKTFADAAQNTVVGILTVFVMLIFLSFIISLFRLIPTDEKRKAAEKAAAKAAPAPVAPATVVEVPETDDTELIAVIAAAIAAAEGTTTDGFVVRSIRKVNRKW